MSANEFEKKVQQKLEELKLSPSAGVWEEVEKRIRKEKKRRIFILLFFLFGALLLAGGIIITKWTENNKIVKTGTIDQKIDKTNPVSIPSQKESIKETKPEINKSDEAVAENNQTEEPRPTINDKKETKITLTERIKSISAEDKLLTKNTPPKSVRTNEPEVKKEVVKNKPVIDQGIETLAIVKNDPIVTSDKPTDSLHIADIAKESGNKIETSQNHYFDKPDSSGINKQDSLKSIVENINDSIATVTTESKPLQQNKKTKKWSFSFMLKAGRSNIAEGVKFFDGNVYADASLYSSPASSPGSGTPQYYYASPVSPSGSYGTGIFAKHPISKRLDLNFGLSYSYFSNKMNVGSRIDSSFLYNSSVALRNFYRPSATGSQAYKNQYHFIRLSSGLSWRFINSKKFQLSWDNELSYDRLLSSNALRFDSNLPGYYKDVSALTRNHIFLTTGLSVPILKRFEINPYTAWSLTHVWRTTSTSKTIFTDYGIRIKVLLGKK
ncbi:MAG: hypothetical protein ABUL41_02500 [Chitinophagaceae bacterium]